MSVGPYKALWLKLKTLVTARAMLTHEAQEDFWHELRSEMAELEVAAGIPDAEIDKHPTREDLSRYMETMFERLGQIMVKENPRHAENVARTIINKLRPPIWRKEGRREKPQDYYGHMRSRRMGP